MLTHQNPAPLYPERVVILGATGFISRHLQSWCASQGVDCLSIGSLDIDLSDVGNTQRLASMLSPNDAIVMTSTLTPDKGRDHHVLMNNLRMAETVCRAMEQAPCAHFVYLSSDAVYDAHQIPLDEDSSREPTDTYALAHTAREMMIGSALAKRSIPLCVLRLTTIYGPGDTHNAYGPNRFVRSALQVGRIEIFGKGEERRSHVFIDDAIALIGFALVRRSSGVLNIATRPAKSFIDIAEIIVRLAGTPIHLDYLPRTIPVIHRPYKRTQLARFIYNLGRPISQVVHRTFVNSAIFEAFPNFQFTPLEQGLSKFMNFERSNLGGNS